MSKESYVANFARECAKVEAQLVGRNKNQSASPFTELLGEDFKAKLLKRNINNDNDTIRELKAEHGVLFVEGMIATGKRLLFSSQEIFQENKQEKKIETVFTKKHLVALQYALTSMGIESYTTEHHYLSSENEKKLVFHFGEENTKKLLNEKHNWEQEQNKGRTTFL